MEVIIIYLPIILFLESLVLYINKKGKVNDIKKYLPTHLIPNEYLLKMDKKLYFGDEGGFEKGIFSDKFNPLLNKLKLISNITEPNAEANICLTNNPIIVKNVHNSNINDTIEKYKNYFKILHEDLNKSLEKNKLYSQEILDIEEERNYYMNKLENVLNLSEKSLSNYNISPETNLIMDDIIKIIQHIPEDFK